MRKSVANINCNQTDSYATIKGISINFNNQTGLLSSMTPEQLFKNSAQSGLANMCWDEFCGSMMSCCGERTINGLTAVTRSPYSGVGASLAKAVPNLGVQYVPPLALSWC